jgi:hypothetical protein
MTLYIPELPPMIGVLDTEDQHHIRTVVGIGTEAMLRISQRFLHDGDSFTEEISPFVIHCIYQTAFLYIQQIRVAQDESLSKHLEILKGTLQRLRWRWKSAGWPTASCKVLFSADNPLEVYLQLLEAREVMNVS